MAQEAAAAVRPWPRPLVFVVLLAYVLVDGALWIAGSLAVFQQDRPAAGTLLTFALVLMLVGGWMWRWWVARGWIGGRPTARFGGSGA